MIKKITLGICLLLSMVALAQENNSSPYSFYGIGDVKFKGTADTRSMGGIGMIPDSIHVNLQNPATYSALKFTTYTLSGTTGSTKLQTSSAESKAGRTTIDYLAVALPFKKIGVAFGLMPYTAVGYRVSNVTDPYPDGYARSRQFDGSGGLNRVFAGAAYRILPNLSIGADFQYYFGHIKTTSVVGIPDAFLQYQTREINESVYSGASANLGINYQRLVNKKYNWFLSATYAPATNVRGTTNRNIATISQTSDGTQSVVDETSSQVSDRNAKVPSKFTVGTGIGRARKWFAGADFTSQKTSVIGNRFNEITNATYKDSKKVAIGGYIIPNFASYTSYLSRITYRAGVRFESTGLTINGQDINDYAVTAGLGLPLSGTIGGSNLNIGLEYGQRGTKAANLIKENYFNVFIALSLNDRWFVKRKYE